MKSVNVVGRGRVGSAIAARLTERGVELREEGAELVLLCVPDRELAGSPPSLRRALGRACERRHTALGSRPARAPLRPAPAANVHAREEPSSSTAPTRRSAPKGPRRSLQVSSWPERWGSSPSRLDDSLRALYHAGAAVASNFLVTLFRAAAELVEAAGAPPEALLPLMRRTIENGFELTGPIERGDWETVEAHLAAIRESHPELEPMYRALADLTADKVAR